MGRRDNTMGKGKGEEEGKSGPCCCGSDVDADGKSPPPDPNGMDRSCTDILFLLFFIAFWVGMVFCAGMAIDKGDLQSLFYFIDYRSVKCGQTYNGTEMGKYVYFTHPTNKFSNICVDKCPDIGYSVQLDNSTTLGYVVSTTNVSDVEKLQSWATKCMATETYNGGLSDSPCVSYETMAPKGLYWCIPTALTEFGEGLSSAGGEYLDDYTQKIKTCFADLIAGWWIIACAAGIALVVSFVWVQILKYCAGCFVWTVLIGSILMTAAMAFGGYYLYDHYKSEYELYGLSNDETLSWTFLVLGAIFAVVCLVMICMIICMCKKIRIGIGIIKEACEAVSDMPLIVLFPLVQYFFLMIFCCYWILIAGYMASTATLTQLDNGTYDYTMDEDMTNALVYHFFGLLWNMAFMRHFTIMVVAGAVGTWYWTPFIDGGKEGLPAMPVYRSCWRTFRYHIGTLAFGSFIIAVIEFMQAVVEYIKQKYMDDVFWLRCLASYIQCCLECFKRIMEFISRQAYIVTACKGKCFCMAAWDAFNFIMDNLGQVVAVNWISMYLMFMGKCFIVCGTTVICWLIADNSDDVNSIIILLLVCAVIAYGVASMFLSVFETAIDTILVCFCWESSAKGSFQGGHVYCTTHLQTWIEGIDVDKATSSAAQTAKVAPGETSAAADPGTAGAPKGDAA